MSRVRQFGLDWKADGEFTAVVNRGWGLNGHPSLQGGMTASLEFSQAVAEKSALDFGRMVLVEDDEAGVPAWSGMIDPPWFPTLPVKATAYSLEYLASLRTPDRVRVLRGSFESVLKDLLLMINDVEDLQIRIGNLGQLPTAQQQLTVKQKSLWAQLNDFAKRESVEFMLRPTYEQRQPLMIYLDADDEMGVDTEYFLHDGENANMQILDASISRKIVNRLIGIGKQDTQGSRLQTAPFSDVESIRKYRMRSEVRQYGNLTILSALNQATQNALASSKRAPLKLQIAIVDSAAFPYCRPGNRVRVHASRLWLPGGAVGWRGPMRILQMAYDETDRILKTTLEAYYT